jgi:hypothetical protein
LSLLKIIQNKKAVKEGERLTKRGGWLMGERVGERVSGGGYPISEREVEEGRGINRGEKNRSDRDFLRKSVLKRIAVRKLFRHGSTDSNTVD